MAIENPPAYGGSKHTLLEIELTVACNSVGFSRTNSKSLKQEVYVLSVIRTV